MKNLLLLIISILLAFPAFAAKKIERILELNDLKEDHLSLFMDDGEIVHINSADTKTIEKSHEALEKSYLVELVKKTNSSDKADILIDIKLIPVTPMRRESIVNPVESSSNEFQSVNSSLISSDPMEFANLTDFSSYEEAQKIMNTFNSDTREDSQCYNRAHTWTYEANVEHGVNLGKVWIFFTKKYIREYSYKWWFHIAPIAQVQGYKYVVDRGFTTIPYNLTNWKNIFIKSKQECTVTTDYVEYETNPDNGHCYLIFSNQFYYQPLRLESLAKTGTVSKDYYLQDIKTAYRDALNNWNGKIPGVQSEGDVFIFRIGESVVDRFGTIGSVVRLRGDELVVKYQNMRTPILQHKGEVGMRRGSAGGFSVGEYVVNRRGNKGQVIAVYIDGFLGVYYSSSRAYTLVHPTSLGR